MTGAPKVSTEMIGPDEAADILKHHNQQNRTLATKTVTQYARAMAAGEWRFVGDPIRFDRGGDLLDGQHRLAAIVESGVALSFVIIRNLEPDTQRYMDAGRKRTAADQLRIEGMTSAPVAASITKLILHWDAQDLPGMNIKFSTFEIVDFTESNLDTIEAAMRHAENVYRSTRGSRAVVGTTYFMACRAADAELASEFMNLVATGAGLATGSPVLLLRQKLIYWASLRANARPDRPQMLYFFVRCWNAWRKGEDLSKLQLPRGSEISMGSLRMRG